jgi:transcriptional regulator with XRE-family HTH domain
MKRKIHPVVSGESFGNRLARLRRAAGYSQRGLADETGISQRMIAYYEKQAEYPPTYVLPILAKALQISMDQLMGADKPGAAEKTHDNRLWRRFNQMEKLPLARRRQIVQIIDAFLENERIRQNS